MNEDKQFTPQAVSLNLKELPFALNEEMKSLRTNILFCGSDKKVILFTSPNENNGKTTISMHLACSLAQLGKHVIFIDADLRKSVLEKKYVANANNIKFGLSHYLSGQCQMSDIFYTESQKRLYIIFAGKYPPNPTELLSSKKMKELTARIKEYADYLIIDTAPIGMVIDAAVIAPYCDGAVVVMKTGETNYKTAQNIIRTINNTGTSILGVVLNKIGETKKGRYYAYGKSGKYSKYGKYGNTKHNI